MEETLGALIIEGEAMELTAKGTRYVCSCERYNRFEADLTAALAKYHADNPLRGGAKRGEALSRFKKELPDFLLKHFVDTALTARVIVSPSGDLLAAAGFRVELTKRQRAALAKMTDLLSSGGFQPPDAGDLAQEAGLDEKAAKGLLQVLVDEGRAVNLDGRIYLDAATVDEGRRILRGAFEKSPELTMSELRTLLGTSRKYALPLLNHYDNTGATTRKGDVRVAGPKLAEG